LQIKQIIYIEHFVLGQGAEEKELGVCLCK